jgi:hypothetical protein
MLHLPRLALQQQVGARLPGAPYRKRQPLYSGN